MSSFTDQPSQRDSWLSLAGILALTVAITAVIAGTAFVAIKVATLVPVGVIVGAFVLAIIPGVLMAFAIR